MRFAFQIPSTKAFRRRKDPFAFLDVEMSVSKAKKFDFNLKSFKHQPLRAAD